MAVKEGRKYIGYQCECCPLYTSVMENINMPQDKVIRTLTDEELYEIALDPETLKTIEAVIKENPQFDEMTFKQLQNSNEFQTALKEYRIKNPPALRNIEVSETMEVLKSVIPKNHIKPNNKLANKMTKDIISEGEVSLIISNKKSKKEVFTKVMLDYDDKYVQFSGREKYKPYDQEVYDGVVTLFAANESLFRAEGMLFTSAMVYRAMNGLTESENVSSAAVELVAKSIDKSRFIKTTIDYTEEAKLYNKDVKETLFEGYLLNAEKVKANINGIEQEVYKLYRKPILYEYAQISGQIITVPMKLLNTKSKINSTEDVIIIRGYLLRQIEWLKNERTNRNENITYQSIYSELEIYKTTYDEAMYKKKTHITRNNVKAILDEWIEQNYIKKYEEYKEGKTIKGVTIII